MFKSNRLFFAINFNDMKALIIILFTIIFLTAVWLVYQKYANNQALLNHSEITTETLAN